MQCEVRDKNYEYKFMVRGIEHIEHKIYTLAYEQGNTKRFLPSFNKTEQPS